MQYKSTPLLYDDCKKKKIFIGKPTANKKKEMPIGQDNKRRTDRPTDRTSIPQPNRRREKKYFVGWKIWLRIMIAFKVYLFIVFNPRRGS